MKDVSLKLSDPILRKLQLLARSEDVTIGQIVRTAIENELGRRDTPTPTEPQVMVPTPKPVEPAVQAVPDLVAVEQPAPVPEPAVAQVQRSEPIPEEPDYFAALRDDLAFASGWHDLSRRLRAQGCFITEQTGVLVIKDATEQNVVCAVEDLGFSYEDLRDRFRAPIPGPRPEPRQERMFSSIRTAGVEGKPMGAAH